MEMYFVVFCVWLMHAGIGLTLAAPIVLLGRKRVRWRQWELLAAVIPFVGWLILMLAGDRSKSLANLSEPFYFAFAIPAAAFTRVAIGKEIDERASSVSLLIALTAVASAVYWFVPSLPE